MMDVLQQSEKLQTRASIVILDARVVDIVDVLVKRSRYVFFCLSLNRQSEHLPAKLPVRARPIHVPVEAAGGTTGMNCLRPHPRAHASHGFLKKKLRCRGRVESEHWNGCCWGLGHWAMILQGEISTMHRSDHVSTDTSIDL